MPDASHAILPSSRDSELRRRAHAVIPGGLWGHLNADRLPEGYPQFFDKAEGCHLIDVDGRRFTDLMCSWGPIVLGHGHQAVERAARDQAAQGDCMNGPAPVLVELAELLVDMVPHADWCLFGKNGTDATTTCVTVARAATGRRKVIVAAGAYHGAVPWCSPSVAGVTAEDRAHLSAFTYNDTASLERAVEQAGSDLAAILVCAYRHDMGQRQELPSDEFAQRARSLADQSGAALILDDVRAGFRLCFMERSAAICALGFERLGHVPFMSLAQMARHAPDLLRLGGASSVYGLVSRYVKDPRLRVALSFHPLFVGGNPFDTTAVYCLISHLERRWGVHFAIGGTGMLVRGLVDLIKGQGGAVRCDADVAEIVVEDGVARGVRLRSGETISAEVVVSDADAAYTYRELVPQEARKRWTDARIDKAKYSMSLFVWYFGTRGHYPDVDHHTIVLGPRYRELLGDIFDAKRLALRHEPLSPSPDGHRPAAGAAGLRRLLRPVPGSPPRRRNRLDDAGRALSPGDRAATVGDGVAGTGGADRHLARDDADGFQGPLLLDQGRGLQPRPDPDAERVVSTQQPERRCQRPLPCRRGNPTRRRTSGRPLLRAHPRWPRSRRDPRRVASRFRGRRTPPPAAS